MQDCPHDFQVWAFNMLCAEPQACLTSFVQTMINAASVGDSTNTNMRFVRLAALFTYVMFYIEHAIYGVAYGGSEDYDQLAKDQVGNSFMFVAQHIVSQTKHDDATKTLLGETGKLKNSGKRVVQYAVMLSNIRLVAKIMAAMDSAGQIHTTMHGSPSMEPYKDRLVWAQTMRTSSCSVKQLTKVENLVFSVV